MGGLGVVGGVVAGFNFIFDLGHCAKHFISVGGGRTEKWVLGICAISLELALLCAGDFFGASQNIITGVIM